MTQASRLTLALVKAPVCGGTDEGAPTLLKTPIAALHAAVRAVAKAYPPRLLVWIGLNTKEISIGTFDRALQP